ncbi:complement regulator-acquiring protein (plasmid) [Borreliella turdi]|uniref:complement regulator-acquiring protein n=2 Tax=Borreliella turdi TaxID=57863 RepID=UPI002649CE3C|nr:complement regulator-acquiring protein [Borreliella turdi]WKC77588.1 complement regulator-acquiring protein [Borreliella turdi]
MKKYKIKFIKLAITLLLCSCNLLDSNQKITHKIEKIIKPIVEKIESDKKENELGLGKIENIFVFVRKKDELSKEYKRQFYSSLEYNKIRIKNILEILNKALEMEKNSTRWFELLKLIGSIIDRGSIFIQNPLEIAILDIYKRKDDLIDFHNKKKLKEIKDKINKILSMKQQWIKNIDKIIITYNDDENLQNNIQELEAYLKKTYENTLKPDSNEIYDLMIEIGRDLQEDL